MQMNPINWNLNSVAMSEAVVHANVARRVKVTRYRDKGVVPLFCRGYKIRIALPRRLNTFI